jgi:hypothetical protein
MAQPNLNARIDKLDEELKKLFGYVDALQVQLANLQAEVKASGPVLAETSKTVMEVKTSAILVGHQIKGLEELKAQLNAVSDLKTEIAVVKNTDVGFVRRDVEQLQQWRDEVKKHGEEWSRKLWLIVPPILAAALTGLINYLIHR